MEKASSLAAVVLLPVMSRIQFNTQHGHQGTAQAWGVKKPPNKQNQTTPAPKVKIKSNLFEELGAVYIAELDVTLEH